MNLKKGSKASQAARNIRSVYKNEAPSIRTCQRWFKQFESRNFTLEDSLRSGRPSSVPLKVLKAVVEENPKQTARELAKQFSTCHRTIITQLNKLRKVSKLSLYTVFLFFCSCVRSCQNDFFHVNIELKKSFPCSKALTSFFLFSKVL